MTKETGSGDKIHMKRGYTHHVAKLGDSLHSVEHFILVDIDDYPIHAAAVVTTDGKYYTGIAVTNTDLDQYNRRRGHEIAVGRAMKLALSPDDGGTVLPNGLTHGKELRDSLRPTLETMARERLDEIVDARVMHLI